MIALIVYGTQTIMGVGVILSLLMGVRFLTSPRYADGPREWTAPTIGRIGSLGLMLIVATMLVLSSYAFGVSMSGLVDVPPLWVIVHEGLARI